ncbi:MAG: hypothetical protein HY717_01590 [Planctomycetes bacterium]|nr:hypothetical protein [Planctomycetota bacterium]
MLALKLNQRPDHLHVFSEQVIDHRLGIEVLFFRKFLDELGDVRIQIHWKIQAGVGAIKLAALSF